MLQIFDSNNSMYEFQAFSESKINRKKALGEPMPEWSFVNENSNKDYYIVDPKLLVAIIADGINSVNQGGRASNLASNLIYSYFKKGYIPSFKKQENYFNIEEAVKSALQNANDELLSLFESFLELGFLATTVDACLIHDNTAHIGHVGNSRVYYLAHDSNALEQLTVDHSTLPDNFHDLNKDEKFFAETCARLTNYVGGNEMHSDYVSRAMSPGDVLFMTTDGVTKCLRPETIYRSLRQSMQRSDLSVARNDLAQKLLMPSEYSGLYSKMSCKDKNHAALRLTDDATFIIIGRHC